MTAATEFEHERPWAARLPWEFVQDNTDERLGVARVLNARNELVCQTTPANADLIVCAVNFLGAQEGPDNGNALREALTYYAEGRIWDNGEIAREALRDADA